MKQQTILSLLLCTAFFCGIIFCPFLSVAPTEPIANAENLYETTLQTDTTTQEAGSTTI